MEGFRGNKGFGLKQIVVLYYKSRPKIFKNNNKLIFLRSFKLFSDYGYYKTSLT